MSSTAHSSPRTLPDATHVASVRLSVANIERSMAWYDRWFGLVAHRLDDAGVVGLAPAGGAVLLELIERPGVEPFGGHHTGLFHFAIRVPDRVDLARWLAHAAQQQLPLNGAADHFVSEAVYLTDPDGHGIEIYWDRPRELWEGRVDRMTTDPLDINDLFAELDSLSISSETARIPTTTDMGHVHLQVADLEESVAFLRDVVGFDLMVQLGREAGFLSTGGYHHDIGVNTWSSRGGAPASEAMARLENVTFALPDHDALSALAARASAAGIAVVERPSGIAIVDPSGATLVFTAAAAS
jgi:catechol 2,3-dioxygenase